MEGSSNLGILARPRIYLLKTWTLFNLINRMVFSKMIRKNYQLREWELTMISTVLSQSSSTRTSNYSNEYLKLMAGIEILFEKPFKNK